MRSRHFVRMSGRFSAMYLRNLKKDKTCVLLLTAKFKKKSQTAAPFDVLVCLEIRLARALGNSEILWIPFGLRLQLSIIKRFFCVKINC